MTRKNLLYIAVAALLGSCSGQDLTDMPLKEAERMPVLFSVGNTDAILTRAQASYMPRDGRFVCSMFFHAGSADTNESAFYADAPFTHVLSGPVDLKQVVNTNKGLVHVEVFGKKVVITSMIDNLLKGAVGQAVQNMNIMFGLDEKAGLNLKASAF